MKMTKNTIKALSFTVCVVLIAAMALFMTACGNTTVAPSDEDIVVTSPTGIGTGETFFPFTVTDVDGNEENFNVYTDKKTVGEALVDAGLISGEDGPYGLYVKTVNGVTYDYDTHQKYWAFYVNGKLAPSGVDTTEIKAGEYYSFKAQ